MANKNLEIVFQIIVHIVVFLFYAIDRESGTIAPYRYANFLNYAITAAVINYVFLPRFYKNKNTLAFVGSVIIAILISALFEEFVVEKIYFEGRRADTIKMTYAFIDIIPVVGILVGVKFGWDAFFKQREVERLEDLVKEGELQFLKSQINPHFLFNNLNNLYSYALEGSTKTPEIILELSGLLRYMLYQTKSDQVDLQKEIEHLEHFVNLNTLQIEDRGNVQFDVPTLSEQYKIAPLIMIVFVENAFKHSQNSQSEDIDISIKIHVDENGVLLFQCSNSYNNDVQHTKKDRGIGLMNVRKRLEIIYPKRHTLDIRDDGQTYSVNLSIHIN